MTENQTPDLNRALDRFVQTIEAMSLDERMQLIETVTTAMETAVNYRTERLQHVAPDNLNSAKEAGRLLEMWDAMSDIVAAVIKREHLTPKENHDGNP